MTFFTLTQRKLLLSGIVFFFLFFYLPVVRCLADEPVSGKVCAAYDLCEVDVHFSLSTVWSGIIRGGLFCPDLSLTRFAIISLTLLFLAGSHILGCALDYYYIRFRDW